MALRRAVACLLLPMLAACAAQVKAPPPVVLAPAPRLTAALPPSAVAAPRTKVALLLPMSGNDRALGNALLDAAKRPGFSVADLRKAKEYGLSTKKGGNLTSHER